MSIFIKFVTVIIFLLLVNSVSYGRQKTKPQPFIIQGQLSHCAKKEFLFFFSDPQKGYKDYYIDTVKIDATGKFYFKTFALIKPTIVTLRAQELSVNFYAAPGYDLTLTGDVSDIKSFYEHKQVKGLGSAANKYLFKKDSMMVASTDTLRWYDMKPPQLLKFVKNDENQQDSLYALVFIPKISPDNWFNDFATITRYEIKSMKLYYLISGASIDTTLTYRQMVDFVKLNFDKQMLADLYNDKYVISDSYRGWLMSTYAMYLRDLDIKQHPEHKTDNYAIDVIKQIANNYKGKIKEIKLYDRMDKAITYCRSFEELNSYKKEFPQYIALLPQIQDREKLRTGITKMENTLLAAQVGKPAPAFTVADSTGAIFSSDRYKGKVIYLDLWASWCAPCRAEAPHLKTLVEKYKGDDNLVFISVAVMDKLANWKNALNQDKPTSLQFFDSKGDVQKAYTANSIPKFILIDKKGNIVSFDAPLPSSGEHITKLIDEQLAK